MSRHRMPISADRDIALLALAVAAGAVVVVLVAITAVSAAITTGLVADTWQLPPIRRWVSGAVALLADPARPGQALGDPWSSALRDRPGGYWTTTILLTLAATAAIGAGAVSVWRSYGPAAPGHASRPDLRRELSEDSARRAATWTRPSLTPAQRRRAPIEEVAVPTHGGPHGRRMYTSLENPTGTLAPTRSGKSRTDLVHKALAAPGALLCSTTKPDLLEFAGLARARRDNAGPVFVADAIGSVPWPARLRWSPVDGCEQPEVALRRADTLVEASAVGIARVAGNDKIFRERAKIVLQAYLLAAALHGGDIGHLVAWSVTKPPDTEPVDILRHHGYTELADTLRAEIGMVAETSDAVWMSVRRVTEPFMDPTLRQLTTPGAGHGFDAENFIAERASLFLIAGEHGIHARPTLTALAEHLLATAQDLALRQPGRRLDPPLTAVLDELYDATPIPRLPAIIADSAGRGVLIHWAAQSWAQLEDLYDTPGQRQLLDNTLTLTLFGGLKDSRTLQWASTLTGHHERHRYQHHTDGLLGSGRASIGTETVPTYRPGDIRTLPHGRVLVIHRNLKPILARTIDVAQRADWPRLRRDIETVRTGTIPIDVTGRLTAVSAVTA